MRREGCSPQMEPHVPGPGRRGEMVIDREKASGSRESRMGEEAGRQVRAIPKLLTHGKIGAFGVKH